MKPSEFYENYWRIDDGKGNLINPPKLTEQEKEFLDNAMKNENCQGVYFGRVRKRNLQINAEVLKDAMDKFPKYFIPKNQPKLDKWGNIVEPEKELND